VRYASTPIWCPFSHRVQPHMHARSQAICGQCCAEGDCNRPPLRKTRFCDEHAALEGRCAIFRRADLPAQPTAEDAVDPNTINDHSLPDDPHAGGAVGGAWCERHRMPGHLVCDDPYCMAMESFYGNAAHRAAIAAGGHRFARASRVKYRSVERSFHRFAKCYLHGYFVFVCACGAVPNLNVVLKLLVALLTYIACLHHR